VTRHRRRFGGIERFTGLAILAALSIVAAVPQAAQAIGHLSALGLLAAAVDAAFQGCRKWEARRPSSASGHEHDRPANPARSRLRPL
jgi:hypothetical protein